MKFSLTHLLTLSLTLLLSARVFGITIGTNVTVTLPKEAEYYGIVNLRPGADASVTYNPPIFSWPYAPVISNSFGDLVEYNFVFQISTNTLFTNNFVNVRTRWNTYNTLAPLTHGTNYFWRIGYIDTWGHGDTNPPATPSTNAWITNSFSIAPNATNWDRSMLADTNYLSTNKVHPYMLWNSTNRADSYAYIQTNDVDAWNTAVALANATTNQSWITSPETPWPALSPYWDFETRITQLHNLVYIWGISQDAKWSNNICSAYNTFASWWLSSGMTAVDYGGGDSRGPIFSLCFDYDILYPIMTTAQRTNAVYTIFAQCYFIDRSLAWRNYDPGAANFPYPPDPAFDGPWFVPYFYMPKVGSSHAHITASVTRMLALAAFNDNPTVKEYFDGHINFLIGRSTIYGSYGPMATGRSYVWENFFNGSFLTTMLVASTIFPEANLTRIPHLNGFADWWSRMIPPGYRHQQEQWGDVKLGGLANSAWGTAENLARLANDGNAMQQVILQRELNGDSATLAKPYGLPNPTATTNTVLGKVFPEDGWVFGSTYPPNTKDCFTNGVGFIFQARPKGSEHGHSHLSDGSYEMWAYGANITCGGGDEISYYGHLAQAQNGLQIDGLGVFYPQDGPRRPYYNKIIAFTNGSDFVYTAADLTYGFPHENYSFTEDGGALVAAVYGASVTNRSYITSVQRHVLFPRRKYLVLFDTFTTTNAATFSWLYHLYEANDPNLNTNTATFSFYATNRTSGNVTAYVAFANSPASLTFTNMTGTNAYKNPEVGSDYATFLGTTAPAYRSHVIWAKNATVSTNHHFLSVIYPVKPGDTPPTITRIDDYTVTVLDNGVTDTNTFETSYVGDATYRISLDAPLEESTPRIGTALNHVRISGGVIVR